MGKLLRLSSHKALFLLLLPLLAERSDAYAENMTPLHYPKSYTHNGELVHIFPESPYLRKRVAATSSTRTEEYSNSGSYSYPLQFDDSVSPPMPLIATQALLYAQLEPSAGGEKAQEELVPLPTLSQLKSGQAKDLRAAEPAIPALLPGAESSPPMKPKPEAAISAPEETQALPPLRALIEKPALPAKEASAPPIESRAPTAPKASVVTKTTPPRETTQPAAPEPPAKTTMLKKTVERSTERAKEVPSALPAGYKPSKGPESTHPATPPLTPLQSKEIPAAPSTKATGLAPGVPAAKPLSGESQRILSRLPANLDKPKKQATPAPVKVEHTPALNDIFPEIGKFADENKKLGIDIVKVNTPDVNVNYELDKAYNALVSGQADTAVGIYQKVLAGHPNNTMALFGLATTFHRKGQLALARPLYGKLLAIDPGNREALNNFLALVGEESPEQALIQLGQLEQTNPDFSPIPAQMAIIYQKIGQLDFAKEKMRRALVLSPANMLYRYNLAVMLDKSGNYAETAELYKQLIAAHERGENISVDIAKIQERLTFIRSNKTRN